MSSPSPPQIEARHLILPTPLPISSLLYDAVSHSLALRHPDSSFSLYPSFSPLSLPSFPSPQTLAPGPTSSASFLHLRSSSSSANPTTLFLTSSPILLPHPSTLLRFYILRADDRFARIAAVSSHRDLAFDRDRFGVVFGVGHGISMRLSGGVNVFTLYSVSSSKVWVFAVRLIGGGEAVKLMKCAVIDCCLPVFTVRVLFRYLVLGEEDGVRVFPLQPLVKGGNHRKEKKSSGRRYNLKNGLSNGIDVAKGGSGGNKTVGTNGDLNRLPAKVEKHSDSVKLRSLRLRQDSKDVGSFFVAFEDKDVESSISLKLTRRSLKAISVEALSANYFLVLDSVGDVHLVSLSYSVQGLDSPGFMKRLTQTMKVEKLAVFNDVSTAARTIWISDGCHNVHLMDSDMDTSFDNTEKKDVVEKLLQTSGPTVLPVTHAIFTSEKIQDIVALAANAVLILGQGNMFAYAIA